VVHPNNDKIKRNKLLIPITVWMTVKPIMLSEEKIDSRGCIEFCLDLETLGIKIKWANARSWGL
jgi:Pyruvate/2-oxoacid:ferredoxin oxidoreductase delta subunit